MGGRENVVWRGQYLPPGEGIDPAKFQFAASKFKPDGRLNHRALRVFYLLPLS